MDYYEYRLKLQQYFNMKGYETGMKDFDPKSDSDKFNKIMKEYENVKDRL